MQTDRTPPSWVIRRPHACPTLDIHRYNQDSDRSICRRSICRRSICRRSICRSHLCRARHRDLPTPMNTSPLLKNLSGLKNFSDLFTQENLEKAVELAKRPAAIAIIASLSIHGLLGLSLPILSSNNADKDKQKAVKLVDLTPAEKSHLPQQSQTAGITFPPLQAPGTGGTTSTTTIPDPLSGSLLKPLPDSSFNSTLANNSLFATPGKPNVISPDYFLNPLPQNVLKPTPTPTPASSPTPTPTASPAPTNPTPAKGGPTPSSEPTPAVQPNAAQIEANRKERMLAGLKMTELMHTAGVTSNSREDQTTRYNNWQAELLKTGSVTLAELEQGTLPMPISLPCPLGNCDEKIVIIIVAVNAEGKLLGAPGLIVKTGDPVLDKAAEQEYNARLPGLQKPPEKKRPTVYMLQIDFSKQRKAA